MTKELTIKSGGMAHEKRARMLAMPEVSKVLDAVETYVLEASSKSPISTIEPRQLSGLLGKVFRKVAADLSIKTNDAAEWSVAQTRLALYIGRYYSFLSVSEIRLAFELVLVGELDAYLPKDAQGMPDRKSYGRLDAEFMTRVLNAYKRRRTDVLRKAYNAVPSTGSKPDDETRKFYHNLAMSNYKDVFLRYKYRGELMLTPCGEVTIYGWLVSNGLADEVCETERDRRDAFLCYLSRAAKGLENKYRASYVRKEGVESADVDFTAFEIARRRSIREAFDAMIADEIQIDNYITIIQ